MIFPNTIGLGAIEVCLRCRKRHMNNFHRQPNSRRPYVTLCCMSFSRHHQQIQNNTTAATATKLSYAHICAHFYALCREVLDVVRRLFFSACDSFKKLRLHNLHSSTPSRTSRMFTRRKHTATIPQTHTQTCWCCEIRMPGSF